MDIMSVSHFTLMLLILYLNTDAWFNHYITPFPVVGFLFRTEWLGVVVCYGVQSWFEGCM